MSDRSFSVRAREHVARRCDVRALVEDLRETRSQLRMTQGEVADILGVSTNAVHCWETGLNTPAQVYARGALVAFLDAAEQELSA